jgi:ubiquinone/menaquinone biosynthesis C-methylase UbiE
MFNFVMLTILPGKKTFRVPLPKTGLEFTGKRFTTLVESEIRHEQVHRYFFALQFCAGKSVPDIASGESYGGALLVTVASRVTGVDVSDDAIRHATENYPAHNLSFHRGEATNVPFAASSIDVV